MIPQREFERALDSIRRTEVHERLEKELRPTSAGAKRQLRVDVLLAAMMLCAWHKPQLTQTAVHKLLTLELSRHAQTVWDIRVANEPVTLRKVRYLWNAITGLYEYTEARRPDMEPDERVRRKKALERLMDDLTGSASRHLAPAQGFAIDQTAIDSAARGKRGNARARADRLEPAGAEVGRAFDPDAMWGYRTKTFDNKTKLVFGFQMNTFTRIAGLDCAEEPGLIDHIRLSPANEKGIGETLDILASLAAAGRAPAEVIADRAYTYTVPEDWAVPLKELGIQQVADIHPKDHGARPHPEHGYIMIDGHPHVASIPAHLIHIDRPTKFSVKAPATEKNADSERWREYEKNRAELERFEQLIAERTQYRFEGHGKTSGGNRRFISPARAWKMRCPGFPPSMQLEDVPDCVHPDGQIPSSCSQNTITVGDAVDRKLRQADYWGSPTWIRSYNRRTAVEGSFGILKSVDDGGGLKRGWTRQVGLVKTSFLLAIYVAAQNLKMLLLWAARNSDERDPLIAIDVTNHGFVEYDSDGNLIGHDPEPPPRT